MVTSIKAEVSPKVLKWARESAGATVEEAANWAGVDAERYLSWEEPGDDVPTIAKLKTLSERFKRPLALLFLSEPPVEKSPPKDFRKPQAAEIPLSRRFNIQFRHALERRELALELMDELEEKPPAFDLRATLDDDPAEVAERARAYIGVSVNDQLNWPYGNRGDIAFNNWRAALEESGILVFQFREVSRDEMRGVSVPEFPLPLIIVNRKEGQNARVFSLFHELTHLMLREGGLCDMSDNDATEIFCNRVAGEFLVPRNALLGSDIVVNHGQELHWGDDELYGLAKRFKVSEETILRRLLLFGKASQEFYVEKRREYSNRRPAQGGPISQDVETLSKLGRRYTDVVLRSYHEGHITFTDAAGYMGVKSKYLSDIEARMYGR